MSKNTVNGSFFAKLFPNASKWFLENASQDEVNKAEQEAAVLHQQMQAGVETTPPAGTPAAGTPAAPVAALPATPAAPVAAPAAPAAGQMPLEVPAPQPSASELTSQLTVMTTRATNAEGQVTTLNAQVTALTTDRDRYKAWHDKHKTLATALPATDSTNKGEQAENNLSEASSAALDMFRKRRTPAQAV
ncbi:hypothetical protein [Spirosoma oryzicola]|uniref:hypothetical protein n=1 Tax=Spirosoma oryzicola TaxID=2898794 RepID=UPI001E311B20|nr:hypothetical protein [Spirosoma oryzicola]UHG93371.1 hypothetical protein LQ777_10810 [Spirosoma oryzicola]